MTLDIILKVLITAIFGYVTLNTFLKFHFVLDRIIALFAVLVVLISIYFLNTTLYFECILVNGIALVLSLVLKLVSIKKSRHGFFLFNTFKKQYDDVSKELFTLAEEFDIPKKNINHNSRKPWLVVLKDVEYKKVNKFAKKLDTIFTHKKKNFSMYIYWTVIVFFTFMAMLWRFL